VFIAPDPENARRTREAMTRFGFDTADVSVEDLLRYKILVRQYVLQVDVHPFAAGVDFTSLWNRSEPTEIAGVPVRVPCLQDLIAMKAAAGRPKDLEDLKFLRGLRDRQ
jgi:predicted nucleotidyltransferase